jgi:hypothetical protein
VAISSIDDYLAAVRTNVPFNKTSVTTSVAFNWFSVFDLIGAPGSGTSAGLALTANGSQPTDATAGFPAITDFGVGATGYLSRVEFYNTVACRISLYDRIFTAGSFNFNANQACTPVSIASRVPNLDYTGLELWYEQAAAGTGIPSVNITYTNESGTTGRSTGTVVLPAAMIARRMFQLPLQAGDSGIQGPTQITATVATVGTFNLHILRPLWQGRVPFANTGDIHDMLRTGMPQVYQDSALFPIINADSTSTGLPDLVFEIASK